MDEMTKMSIEKRKKQVLEAQNVQKQLERMQISVGSIHRDDNNQSLSILPSNGHQQQQFSTERKLVGSDLRDRGEALGQELEGLLHSSVTGRNDRGDFAGNNQTSNSINILKTTTMMNRYNQRKRILHGQTTQEKLIFNFGVDTSTQHLKGIGKQSVISDLDACRDSTQKASQVLNDIGKYFEPMRKSKEARERYQRNIFSQSAEPENPLAQSSILTTDASRRTCQVVRNQFVKGSRVIQPSRLLIGDGSLQKDQFFDRESSSELVSVQDEGSDINFRATQTKRYDPQHQKKMNEFAKNVISRMENKIKETPIHFRKLQKTMGYTKSKVKMVVGRTPPDSASAKSPRRRESLSMTRRTDSTAKIVEKSQEENSISSSQLPIIQKIDARMRQLNQTTNRARRQRGPNSSCLTESFVQSSEVQNDQKQAEMRKVDVFGSASQVDSTVDKQSVEEKSSDESEHRAERFMSQREKDLLKVARQRKYMAKESQKMEIQYLKELRDTKANQKSPKNKQSIHSRFRSQKQIEGVLPLLDELDSKGKNLNLRIKNYKANLSALDGPVVDQIERAIQKINLDNEKQKLEELTKYQMMQKYRSLRSQSFLSPASLILSRERSVSPLSGLTQSLNDLSAKKSVESDQKLRVPNNQQNINRGVTVMLQSVKQRINKLIERKKQISLQKQLDMIPVKSKNEIIKEIEKQQEIRKRKEERKGQKLMGSSGSLDLTLVDKMQRVQKDRYIKFLVPREIDKLVYKSYEKFSETTSTKKINESRSSYATNSMDLRSMPETFHKTYRNSQQFAEAGTPLNTGLMDFMREQKFKEKLKQGEMDKPQSISGSQAEEIDLMSANRRFSLAEQGLDFDLTQLKVPQFTKKDKKLIKNLTMLHDQRPSSRERDLQNKYENRKLLLYLNEFENEINAPKLRQLRRLQCLDNTRYDFLNMLNMSQEPGGTLFVEKLKQEKNKQKHPFEQTTYSRGLACSYHDSNTIKAASRAVSSAMSPVTQQKGQFAMKQTNLQFTIFDQEDEIKGLQSQESSSGLHTDESVAKEQLQLEKNQYFDNMMEDERLEASALVQREEGEETSLKDGIIAGSQTFDNFSELEKSPAFKKAMTRLQVDVNFDSMDCKLNRSNSLFDHSMASSDVDRESAIYNDSQIEREKDTNDEQAFRKNTTEGQKQQELVNDVSTILIQRLKDINQKRQYITKIASIEHLIQQQPAYAFFAECMYQQELDIPVFRSFIEHALIIQNQRLSAGHAVALYNGFKVVRKKNIHIKELILQDNDIDDASMAVIIEGAIMVPKLSRFESIGNEFSHKAVHMLSHLILRPAPNKLKQLKLSNCKLPMHHMETLLKIMSKKCVLDTLHLQNCHYNKQGIKYLCDLIDTAKFLTNLDISFCHIKEKQPTKYYTLILTSLSENRKLNFINISWNNFCGSLPGSYLTKELLKEKQEEIATLITRIIKYNKKIMHLNLENTGISRNMIKVIYPSLRKAMSLQSIHLSHNPWLIQLLKKEPKLIQKIHKTIKAKMNLHPYISALEAPDKPLKKAANNYELIKLQQIHQKQSYWKMLNGLELLIDPFWNNTFIIQRRLGHKLEMPGSGQWQILSDIVKHERPINQIARKKAQADNYDEIQLPQSINLDLSSMNDNILGPFVKLPDSTIEDESPLIKEKINVDEQNLDQDKQLSLNDKTNNDKSEESPEKQKDEILSESSSDDQYETDLNKLTVPQMPDTCSCWMCQRQRFVLFFWSRRIAQKVRSENKRLQELEVQAYVKKLRSNVIKNIDESEGEDRQEILQHLHFNLSYSQTSDLFSENKMRDPKIRAEFEQALKYEQKKEFGPIINASLSQDQDQLILKLFEKKYNKYIDMFYDTRYDQSPEQTPFLINGASHSYYPQEMIELTDYCGRLDFDSVTGMPARQPKIDIMKQMKDQYTIPQEKQYFEDLSKVEKLQYKLIQNREERVLRKDCLAVLVDSLRYRQPMLINSQMAFEELESQHSSKIFVIPLFLPPGKHSILISQKDRFEPEKSCHLVLQNLIVEPREEPIKHFCKIAKNKKIELPVFNKEKSVFKDWKEDDKKTYDKSLLEHDFLFWKVNRFIKEKSELDECKSILMKKMPIIRELYAYAQAESQVYPGINQTTLTDLCKLLHVIDKNFQSKDSDRHFVACTSVRNKDQTEVIEAATQGYRSRVEPNTSIFSWQGMKRFEFLEFIMRLIRNKYLENMGYTSFPQGLRHFFQNYAPNFINNPSVKLWQIWREKELWTLDVNECLDVNLENLRLVYQAFSGQKRTFMNRAEAIKFMQWDFEKFKEDTKVVKKGPAANGAAAEGDKSLKVEQSAGDPVDPKDPANLLVGSTSKQGKQSPVKGNQSGSQLPLQFDSVGPGSLTEGKRSSQIRMDSSARGRRGSDVSGTSAERNQKDTKVQGMQQASYLTLSEKQASFCYSMCKMTVNFEELDGLRHYDKLQFVEFLELLGRIAQIRFEGTDLQKEPLVIRLEYILESALAIVGLERIEVVSKEQDWSESDQDY